MKLKTAYRTIREREKSKKQAVLTPYLLVLRTAHLPTTIVLATADLPFPNLFPEAFSKTLTIEAEFREACLKQLFGAGRFPIGKACVDLQYFLKGFQSASGTVDNPLRSGT